MSADKSIVIDASSQQLHLMQGDACLHSYTIATATKGLGEEQGSEKTPRGWHEICEKIGAGCEINTVFVGRKPTGELYSPALAQQFPQRDWVLSRILWLRGLEEGKNQLGTVDTKQRYIYIHGCPDEITLGIPSSHGCIRMRNEDVVALFDRVDLGMRVYIQ